MRTKLLASQAKRIAAFAVITAQPQPVARTTDTIITAALHRHLHTWSARCLLRLHLRHPNRRTITAMTVEATARRFRSSLAQVPATGSTWPYRSCAATAAR